jgi:hypothetical protein
LNSCREPDAPSQKLPNAGRILAIDSVATVNAWIAPAAKEDWSKEGIDFLARRRDEINAAPQYQRSTTLTFGRHEGGHD